MKRGSMILTAKTCDFFFLTLIKSVIEVTCDILPEHGFLDFYHSLWFCSEEDPLPLCVNTQELVLKTLPQRYERGCKREACGNVAWRNRWLTLPLEHVHQCAALTNWTHGLPPTHWHFVANWVAECCLFESYRHDGISKFNPFPTINLGGVGVGGGGGGVSFAMLNSVYYFTAGQW